MAAAISVTDGDFQKVVLKSDVPVLVDFTATWCPPCQTLAPVIEELAGENAGKAKIVKADVDECQAAASEAGVSSIPALVIFKSGAEAERSVGAQPKSQIQAMIDRNL